MATQTSTPSITILPRLAFGAPMPRFCESAVNGLFKPKDNGSTQAAHRPAV